MKKKIFLLCVVVAALICAFTITTLAVEIDGIDSIKGDLAKGFIIAVEHKLNLASEDRESLVPLYVKKSQAEEELC